MRRHDSLFATFLDHALRDLDGLLDEMQFQCGTAWPAAELRRLRRGCDRLRALVRADGPTTFPPAPNSTAPAPRFRDAVARAREIA